MDTPLMTGSSGLSSSPPLPSASTRSGILSSTSSSSVAPGALSRAECAGFSASCYCEENAVRVLQLALSRGYASNRLFAIFISNPQRRVPMQFQRAGGGVFATAVWDYHVVAEVCCEIYDVDSFLPFPSARSDYFRRSCRPQDGTTDQVYQFRRVKFDEVDALFASDRRHMRDALSGRLRMIPPVKEPIRGRLAASEHTLNSFLIMGERAQGDPFRVENESIEAPGELFPSLEAFLKDMEGDGG